LDVPRYSVFVPETDVPTISTSIGIETDKIKAFKTVDFTSIFHGKFSFITDYFSSKIK